MSDFEFFQPGEGSESYDPAAFERFREQMKKSAAQMAAAQKSEQRQKEKEDRLARILMKFIQSNQKSALLMLAAKLLKENIPASFVLAVILLGDDEIKEQIKKEVNLTALPEPEERGQESAPAGEFSLATRFSNAAFPLRMKAEIDEWAKNMMETASGVPFKIFETVLNQKSEIKPVVTSCLANVLDDYLKTNSMPGPTFDMCYGFGNFFLEQMIQSLQKQVEGQKELK